MVAGGAGVQVAAARGEVSDLVASSLLGQCVWLGLGMALAVASVASDTAVASGPPGGCAGIRGSAGSGAAAALAGLIALLEPAGLTGIIQSLNTQQPIPETLAVVVLTGVLVALLVLPAVFGEDAGGAAEAAAGEAGRLARAGVLRPLPLAPADGPVFDRARRAEPPPGLGPGLIAELPFAVTPILLLLTLIVSAALAAASYYLVELPFLRRKEG